MTVPFLYKLKTNTNGHDIIDANVFSFKLMRFPSRKRKTGPYYTINVHEKFNTSNQMFCCTLNSSLGIWWNIFWETKKEGREKIAWAARRVCYDSQPQLGHALYVKPHADLVPQEWKIHSLYEFSVKLMISVEWLIQSTLLCGHQSDRAKYLQYRVVGFIKTEPGPCGLWNQENSS